MSSKISSKGKARSGPRGSASIFMLASMSIVLIATLALFRTVLSQYRLVSLVQSKHKIEHGGIVDTTIRAGLVLTHPQVDNLNVNWLLLRTSKAELPAFDWSTKTQSSAHHCPGPDKDSAMERGSSSLTCRQQSLRVTSSVHIHGNLELKTLVLMQSSEEILRLTLSGHLRVSQQIEVSGNVEIISTGRIEIATLTGKAGSLLLHSGGSFIAVPNLLPQLSSCSDSALTLRLEGADGVYVGSFGSREQNTLGCQLPREASHWPARKVIGLGL